jgi:hypothetical protein
MTSYFIAKIVINLDKHILIHSFLAVTKRSLPWNALQCLHQIKLSNQ